MDIVDSQVHIWGPILLRGPGRLDAGRKWVMGRGVREWLGWR